jgi:hypothetical protein
MNVPFSLQELASSTRYLAEDTRSKSRVFSRSNKLQRRCHVTNDLLHHEGIRAGDTRSEFALIALQIGPAMKRLDCRVRAVSSRKSLLAVG